MFHLVSLSNVKLSGLILCQLSKVTHSPFEHLSPFGAQTLETLQFREIYLVGNEQNDGIRIF